MVATAIIMVMLSSHPAFVMAQEKAEEDAAETDSGELMPHTMKATTKVAVLKKVILSRAKALRWSSTPMPGTKPGCMSWG